jgi:hypothetical protein
MSYPMMKTPEQLIDHLLYGDVYEMRLDILGDEEPCYEDYQNIDNEQELRLCMAATVKAFFEGRLSGGGWYVSPPDSQEIEPWVA